MHVLHNFFQVERKHNFLLGPIHPLSPTSNELHGITKHVDFFDFVSFSKSRQSLLMQSKPGSKVKHLDSASVASKSRNLKAKNFVV